MQNGLPVMKTLQFSTKRRSQVECLFAFGRDTEMADRPTER